MEESIVRTIHETKDAKDFIFKPILMSKSYAYELRISATTLEELEKVTPKAVAFAEKTIDELSKARFG